MFSVLVESPHFSSWLSPPELYQKTPLLDFRCWSKTVGDFVVFQITIHDRKFLCVSKFQQNSIILKRAPSRLCLCSKGGDDIVCFYRSSEHSLHITVVLMSTFLTTNGNSCNFLTIYLVSNSIIPFYNMWFFITSWTKNHL